MARAAPRRATEPAACLSTHSCVSTPSPPPRVTPDGGAPVEGPTPTAAWAALFESVPSGKGSAKDAAAAAARAAGRSGTLIFGLQHARVRALLQQLPGAARLERLLAWEGGERPELPPLVSSLVTSHAALPCLLGCGWGGLLPGRRPC